MIITNSRVQVFLRNPVVITKMTCPNNIDLRQSMCNESLASEECKDIWDMVPNTSTLKVLLGGKFGNLDFESLIPVWCNAAFWIHRMYMRTVNKGSSIG